MKKSRAIFLLITLAVAIGGYVAWAAWEPAPTLQSMRFQTDVDAVARSAAEADFHSHPPKARNLKWQRLWNRLIHPYEPREELLIPVGMASQPDGAPLSFTGIEPLTPIGRAPQSSGAPLLAICYPRDHIFLARGHDGTWYRAYRRTAFRVRWIP
jgi:hypothetical protein